MEVTAEIEATDWDYMLMSDPPREQFKGPRIGSIFSPRTVRCVVGTNTWMIQTLHTTRWFTGTEIIEETAVTNATDLNSQQIYVGRGIHRQTRVFPSTDGNPGRPVGVADIMTFDLPAKVGWLAFCSGLTLKQAGRTVYPTSDFWKEYIFHWTDQTSVFHDELGLPESINLITTNNLPLFNYRVHTSTNIMGWNFPLEFYSVQYISHGTNAPQVDVTVKGRVKTIGPGTEPIIPPEVLKAIKK
ncbi:MAG TPA: hypothetical protein VH413_04660 [Verrucomicrobiae bacterium]|nr:hypothetical protein [Verrucomicrobiae bacterium]